MESVLVKKGTRMGKMFSYDSPVWKFMGRLADFFILTVLWSITSIPIITIGVSTTTVYYITLKMVEDQEEYLIPMYVKTFVKVFQEAFFKGICFSLAGIVLALDLFICYTIKNTVATLLLAAFAVIFILYFMMLIYFFPVMARTNQSFTKLVKTSFYLSIRYFSWSILLMVIPICIFITGIFIFWPLLLFSIGLMAYLQSLIINPVFKKQGWNLQ